MGIFHIASQERVDMLKIALSFIKDESVSGDYFEFGVARGSTFIAAYHLAGKKGVKIDKFHAFDSFEGFPQPKGVDKEFERFKKGEECWPEELFKNNLKSKSVNLKRTKIYKGWFKDILTEDLQKKILSGNCKIALAWIDCDLYESTKDVLEFIPPLLTQGTVLVFDDWYCYRGDSEKGEQRAVAEFLKKNKDIKLIPYRKFGIVGNSFIVNLRK